MDKGKFIIEFLKKHECKAFYIDVRTSLSQERAIFDSELDFDKHLEQLVDDGLVFVDDETVVHLMKHELNHIVTL